MTKVELDINDETTKVLFAQQETLRLYKNLTPENYLIRLLLLGAIQARKEQDDWEWREFQNRALKD